MPDKPAWTISWSHYTNQSLILKEKAPPLWGKRGGAVFRDCVRLFLLFEGKRKLERLIFDGDAEHQLLQILATLEPDCAGNFAA